jgi:protein-tyrosine phosphatase
MNTTRTGFRNLDAAAKACDDGGRGSMIDRVLMVCVGNICRSPMAEALLRARLDRRGGGVVESAGISALVGRPPEPFARDLLAERGIDIGAHRARQLTPEILARAELVLVMESGHQREIERLMPSARGRVQRIGRFGGFDVADPYRQPRAEFEKALALIERGLDDFEKALWRAA